MSGQPLGADVTLLRVPTRTIAALQAQAESGQLQPSSIAALPRFLRTFYLRFLNEAVGIRIKRFDLEEGGRISDCLVDLEGEGKASSAWPLLADFADLCRYFDDFGLMSVPQAAQEHDAEIFELTARILYDLASWAQEESFATLQREASNLALKLEALNSGARAG